MRGSPVDGPVASEALMGGVVDGLPDSAGLVPEVPDGTGPLVEVDDVAPGPVVVGLAVPLGVADGPPVDDDADPETDGDGAGRTGTSEGDTGTSDGGVSDGSRGVFSRTSPGAWDGTPGTGSTDRGAKGVAPMKLSTSTTVYTAHGTPSP
ncbi:hypothetical protein ACJWDR_01740 [Streptomyces tauricus]|uniref:hypothetical protein n=1 Tax=Streptomyces tauricus TaxID=68274 RepID=UPI00387F29CF